MLIIAGLLQHFISKQLIIVRPSANLRIFQRMHAIKNYSAYYTILAILGFYLVPNVAKLNISIHNSSLTTLIGLHEAFSFRTSY